MRTRMTRTTTAAAVAATVNKNKDEDNNNVGGAVPLLVVGLNAPTRRGFPPPHPLPFQSNGRRGCPPPCCLWFQCADEGGAFPSPSTSFSTQQWEGLSPSLLFMVSVRGPLLGLTLGTLSFHLDTSSMSRLCCASHPSFPSSFIVVCSPRTAAAFSCSFFIFYLCTLMHTGR